jgi:hypothetical protein
MKYSELERKLKKAGCYEDGEMNGHPLFGVEINPE